jgi:cardiolipin synthase
MIEIPAQAAEERDCHAVCYRYDPHWRCTSGNLLQLLSSGEAYVPAMLQAIEEAKTQVMLELYRVDPGRLWDRFLYALAGASRRGVDVRLLVDAFGSRRMTAHMWRSAAREGLRVVHTPGIIASLLRKGSTRRDHRKLLVVDGQTAFTGGMSIDDTFFRPAAEQPWRESMVVVRGPLVGAMQASFEAMWQEFGGRPRDLTYTDRPAVGQANARLVLSSPRSPFGEAYFAEAIGAARSSVWITNPFVVPSPRISHALVTAAQNGVDVRLLVPGRHHRFSWVRHAMRGFYSAYLDAGIRIYEYELAMLHAKTVVVDQRWASVGSFNLDSRSFVSNDELAVAACDAQFAQHVTLAFERDCEDAEEVSRLAWRKRSLTLRCREGVASVLKRYL